MEAYLKEIQADFMPEDSNIGIIQEWLDSHDYEYVCSRQIYDLALKREGNDPKQWELKKINDIMNNSIQGWAPVSSHRFAELPHLSCRRSIMR